MTQAEFMSTLNKQLRFRVTLSEREQILSDYAEYFDAGRSEGKSEQQLAAEFGEPKTIVGELMNERGSYSAIGALVERFKIVAEWLGLGEKYIRPWIMPVNILLLIGAAVYIFLIFEFGFIMSAASENPAVGPLLRYSGETIIVMSALCFVAWLFCFRIRRERLPMIVVNLAVFCEMTGIRGLLRNLADPSFYYDYLQNLTREAILQTVLVVILIYVTPLLAGYFANRRGVR